MIKRLSLGLLYLAVSSQLYAMDSSSLCKVVALQETKRDRKFSNLKLNHSREGFSFTGMDKNEEIEIGREKVKKLLIGIIENEDDLDKKEKALYAEFAKSPWESRNYLDQLRGYQFNEVYIDRFMNFSNNKVDPCQWLFHNMPQSVWNHAALIFYPGSDCFTYKLSIFDENVGYYATYMRFRGQENKWSGIFGVSTNLSVQHDEVDVYFEGYDLNPDDIFGSLLDEVIPSGIVDWYGIIVACLQKHSNAKKITI